MVHTPMPQFQVTTSRGLSEILKAELQELEVPCDLTSAGLLINVPWLKAYELHLLLRTATRVLYPIFDSPVYSEEDLLKVVGRYDWTQWIEPQQTLAIDASCLDSRIRDHSVLALKSKDAIVDQFREKYGVRPDVDKRQPHLPIVLRLTNNILHASLDLSGEALFKRGYRIEQGLAPLKEHLAAGLLGLAMGAKALHDPSQVPVVVDPVCGSGTFLIEAAMMAANVPSGSLRRRFAFMNWKNFDKAGWQKLSSEIGDRKILSPEIKNKVIDGQMKSYPQAQFFGSDISNDAVRSARENVQEAGLKDWIQIRKNEASLIEPPLDVPTGLVVMNPPYGERLTGDLEDVYRDIGYALKKHFKGWTVWLLCGNPELASKLGMKTSLRVPVWNGRIECRWLKYEVRS